MTATLMLLPPLLLLLLVPLLHGASSPSQGVQHGYKRVSSGVCYDGIGCFSTGGHFHDRRTRPIQLVPQSPERIGVTYALYTRDNIVQPQYIRYNDRNSVRRSNFNGRRETKVITHGFLEDAREKWMLEMKKAMLLHGDYNVLLLDWSGGNQLPYTQATANTRVVGALLAQMALWLESQFGASRTRLHLIGHSLGSHIAGYAGERMRSPQLGRITGLDPAGPYFENTHPVVRLDPTDAAFVDAIHTDGDSLLSSIKLEGGFGLMQPSGHIDFYPNGGQTQPDCSKNPIVRIIVEGIIEGTKWTVACHHLRVLPLMTQTILNRQGDYKAVPCDSYKNFKAGRCDSCGPTGCALMGMSANQWRPNGRTGVKMFLDTTGREPFELNHYVVKVTLSGVADAARQYGDISLILEGEGGRRTPELEVISRSYLEPGHVVRTVVTASSRVFDLRRIRLAWRHRWWISITRKHLRVNRIEIFEAFKEKQSLYCAKDDSLQSGRSVWLTSSSFC